MKCFFGFRCEVIFPDSLKRMNRTNRFIKASPPTYMKTYLLKQLRLEQVSRKHIITQHFRFHNRTNRFIKASPPTYMKTYLLKQLRLEQVSRKHIITQHFRFHNKAENSVS